MCENPFVITFRLCSRLFLFFFEDLKVILVQFPVGIKVTVILALKELESIVNSYIALLQLSIYSFSVTPIMVL